MSTLFYRRYVNVPYGRARGYLEDALGAYAISGEPQMVRLAIPLPENGEARLQKDVVVTYGPGTDPMHFDEPWKLHWHPQGGLFPDFDGELTVRADEDYTSCALELRGTYLPPLGAAGAAFDAILGSRLASSTARELLREIGSRIEERFKVEEAAKSTR